jgi:hypothetical protein
MFRCSIYLRSYLSEEFSTWQEYRIKTTGTLKGRTQEEHETWAFVSGVWSYINLISGNNQTTSVAFSPQTNYLDGIIATCR